MKLYCLEFASIDDGTTERIWHTNRRALERYSRTLKRSRFQILGIRSFEVPTPLTNARMVAFLNEHCADFMPARPRPGGVDGDHGRDRSSRG